MIRILLSSSGSNVDSYLLFLFSKIHILHSTIVWCHTDDLHVKNTVRHL